LFFGKGKEQVQRKKNSGEMKDASKWNSSVAIAKKKETGTVKAARVWTVTKSNKCRRGYNEKEGSLIEASKKGDIRIIMRKRRKTADPKPRGKA